MEFVVGASWQTLETPSDQMLDRVVEEFEVADGQPCVRVDDWDSRTVIVTWDAQVTLDAEQQDPYEVALAEARAYVPDRMARAGIPGRLARLDAITEEGMAGWRPD